MLWLLASVTLLGLLALGLQISEISTKGQKRKAAQEASRKAWLSQDEKHPHIAAHFGNYAYKEPSALTVFDPGLTSYTGTSVYMEPHRQNDFLLNESSERDTGSRFGWFTPSFVCQLLVPLLIILLTFNLVIADRLGGVYKLCLSQGATSRQLLFGKTAAAFFAFAAFITVYLLFTGLTTAFVIRGPFPIVSFLYLWCAYLLYYALWCGIGVLTSALAKTPGTAISVLLLFWIITSVILPKWAATTAENLHPLISNYAFKKKVAQDIANGLNGHDVASDRARRIQDSVLKAEGVDSVEQLKFNFEGYIMQRGEEYSSNVYDTHFKTIYDQLEGQRRVQSLVALASPAMLLRNLSMAACNASLETEIRFQQDAEKYRRGFVQAMNEDMMHHSKWGDEGWLHYKVKKQLYSEIRDFTAPTQPLHWRLGFVQLEQGAIIAWVLLTAFGLWKSARKTYL